MYRLLINKLVKLYPFVKSNLHNILPVSITIFLILYNTLINFGAQKIGTDAVSWLLPAKFLIENKGYPYADFWDTKPPGLILFLSVWLKVFGESVYSMRFLGLTLLSVILFGIMNIYRMVFNKLFYNIIYILSAIVFMSSLVQTQSLMIEWFGLAFALLAINILIFSNSIKKLFFAGIFFTLAGQMKESYAPIVLSVIPYLLTKFNKKRNYLTRNIQFFYLEYLQ